MNLPSSFISHLGIKILSVVGNVCTWSLSCCMAINSPRPQRSHQYGGVMTSISTASFSWGGGDAGPLSWTPGSAFLSFQCYWLPLCRLLCWCGAAVCTSVFDFCLQTVGERNFVQDESKENVTISNLL